MTINVIPDGIYVDVNQAFASMVGYTREALIGRRAIDLDIIKPQERQPVVEDLTKTGLLSNSPVLLRRPTGELREGIVSAQLEEHEGRLYAIAFVQDLTEYHRAQDALLAAEVRFRLLFDSVPLPIWVFDLETLRILDANPSATQAYGYSIEELRSMTLMDLHAPDTRDAFRAYRPHLKNSSTGAVIWRHQRKDGALLDVSVSGYTFDLDGRRVRLDVSRDVTERLAAERALVEREQKLKIITELSTDGIWEWDREADTYALNEAYQSVFGAPQGSEGLIAWWMGRIHPDDRARVDRFFRAILESGPDHWSTEYRMLRAGGATYANVLTRGRVIRDERGQMAHMIGALVDITTQIEAAEAAARATLAERERLAHELHDSVTQSLYSVTLLAEAARRRSQSGDHMATMAQITRLGELSQQCLREMRLLVYELRPPLVEELGLIGALQYRLEAVEQRSGIRVSFLIDGDDAIPNRVRNTLFQVAEEMLNKALRQARTSTLTVRAGSSPAGVELEITANGLADDDLVAADLGDARERIGRLGGDLQIRGAPGLTTIYVRVPLKTRDDMPTTVATSRRASSIDAMPSAPSMLP